MGDSKWKRPKAIPDDHGPVTIVVIGVPRGVLIEIIDDGSAGTPAVKGDLYAAR